MADLLRAQILIWIYNCHLPLVPGRANAEVSKKNNDHKKPMAYRNVCDIQQR